MGQISQLSKIYRNVSVHPHVRGANVVEPTTEYSPYGSSPRAWGKFVRTHIISTNARFIPTCVGQIPIRLSLPPHSTVHPHVRGANCKSSKTTVGYSVHPHVRGANCKSYKSTVGYSVHPHVRGANVCDVKQIFAVFGSSPRAWGK